MSFVLARRILAYALQPAVSAVSAISSCAVAQVSVKIDNKSCLLIITHYNRNNPILNYYTWNVAKAIGTLIQVSESCPVLLNGLEKLRNYKTAILYFSKFSQLRFSNELVQCGISLSCIYTASYHSTWLMPLASQYLLLVLYNEQA